MQERVILVQEEPRPESELVEIPVLRDGLQKVPIPTIDQLRSDDSQKIIIKGIRVITAGVAVGAPILEGVTSPTSELQKMYLVLYAEGWEKGHYIPILVLNDMNDGAGSPFRFNPTKFNNWEKVDWNKSFIQLANGQVTAGSPYNVLLDVEYIRIATEGANKGLPIVGPS